MNSKDYTFDREEMTMVFSVDTKRHVRVAYSDGQVWYAMCDIAKLLLGYRAPGSVVNKRDYRARLLRVPHISPNVRGYTNVNCITKDALKQFVKLQSSDPKIYDWITTELIPTAERQFAVVEPTEPKLPEQVKEAASTFIASMPTAEQAAALLDQLDQFIIAAVSLQRQLRAR